MSAGKPSVYPEQLEALGRLSPVVAHDINNLLSAILGYSQILLAEPTLEPLKPYVREIESAGKRIASLSRLLLVFGRECSPNSERLNLNQVIREMERYIPAVIGSEIDFAVIPDPDLRPLQADPAWIRQALLFMAIGMREMLPDGGKFILETQNIAAPDELKDVLQDAGNYVRITATAAGRIAGPQSSSLPEREGRTLPATRFRDWGIAALKDIFRLCGGYLAESDPTEKEWTFRGYLAVADTHAPRVHPGSLPENLARNAGLS